MYAETGFYNRTPNGGATPVGAITNLPGVNASDLNGKYFQSTDYRLTAVGDATYTLQVTGSTQDVLGVTITLDQAGTFNRSGL
jgi:hypothetical protein